MYGMYPMMGMMGMMGSMFGMGGNVYQAYKNQYGVGYEDFGHKPYFQGYPMAIIQRANNTQESKGIGKILKDLYA